MDTTSNALSRVFQLLAQHPDVQTKLRAEIVEAQGGDGSDIAHDDLLKLPYLDAVCRETLRVHNPVVLSGPRMQVYPIRAALHCYSYSLGSPSDAWRTLSFPSRIPCAGATAAN